MKVAPMAARYRLAACSVCGLMAELAVEAEETEMTVALRKTENPARCRRCQAPLHLRKPDSLNRSWAFLIAACLLYFPANLLPVMETRSPFGTEASTILSGIAFLWHSGSWVLALVVLVASVVVPMLKLFSLTYLLLSVQRQSTRAPQARTRLYRWLELIGRWSMLDVYVVAVLVALVQVQSLASIVPGPGVVAFGAVVVLSMLATMSFDPRLIWDAATPYRSKETVHE